MSQTGGSRSSGAPSRANIVDVAQRAGVSVATVSRALRGMGNVSAQTRERVVRAADELAYTASPLASGLVTGRIRSVGVVAPYAGRWFFAEVLRGIEGALRERGYDLVLHVLADAPGRARFFRELPLRRRVDAVAVVALPLTPRELEVLRGLGVPLVSVGETLDRVHAEVIDNVAAARIAVDHLINLGHHRIAMIGGDGGPEGFVVPGLRAQGYREALESAGLPVHLRWQLDGRYTPRGGEQAMTALLSRPGGRPSAVFCQSDEMAFGALRALRHSGLRCPDDVSLAGMDDHELAETFDVTTVAQPVAEQGAAAANWLIEELDRTAGNGPGAARTLPESEAGSHANGEVGDRRHPVRLVLRGSTAPARAD